MFFTKEVCHAKNDSIIPIYARRSWYLYRIYFPRKAAYQGTIFDALRKGHNIGEVKKYLNINIEALLAEFQVFPKLFDPDRYTKDRWRKTTLTVEKARRRIEMYQSPFWGWSFYQVDGVYIEPTNEAKLVEEATQVVRIMFRYRSGFADIATDAQCQDVLRAILYWTIEHRGHLVEFNPWDKSEQKRFIEHHQPWPQKKRAFVNKYFKPIVKECQQWVDDCALFVFGYLVRNFSENVLIEKQVEKEIWVTRFFVLTISAVKRVGNQGLNIQRNGG